jgi:hypothetical protein
MGGGVQYTITSYAPKRVVAGTKKRVSARFLVEHGDSFSVLKSPSAVWKYIMLAFEQFVKIDFFYTGKDRHDEDIVPIETRTIDLITHSGYKDALVYIAALMKRLE